MRLLLVFLLGLLVSSPALGGSFDMIESSERKTTEPTAEHPVQVGELQVSSTILQALGTVSVAWSVEVRSLTGTSCYVEVHFYDARKRPLGWSNANAILVGGSAIASGSLYLREQPSKGHTRTRCQ